jgi:hypothetical protein
VGGRRTAPARAPPAVPLGAPKRFGDHPWGRWAIRFVVVVVVVVAAAVAACSSSEWR